MVCLVQSWASCQAGMGGQNTFSEEMKEAVEIWTLQIATGDNEMLMSMKQILMGQVCFLMNKHIALQKECR